jgi:hypothetical protein
MDKKIIAFSSTHGTGKSSSSYTIASKMKVVGYNVVVLDELARRSPFPINQGAGPKTQAWLMAKQITEELELSDRYDLVITDRGVFDAYCYSMVLGHTELTDYALPLIQHVKTYYKHLYVLDHNSFSYHIADGVRDMDPRFRENVQLKILEVYRQYGVDYKLIHSIEEVYKDLNLC